jgi:hypothetical protein
MDIGPTSLHLLALLLEPSLGQQLRKPRGWEASIAQFGQHIAQVGPRCRAGSQGRDRTRGTAVGNLKQDAPLPAITLISLGFSLPSRSPLSHLVPPDSAPEGHIRGT